MVAGPTDTGATLNRVCENQTGLTLGTTRLLQHANDALQPEGSQRQSASRSLKPRLRVDRHCADSWYSSLNCAEPMRDTLSCHLSNDVLHDNHLVGVELDLELRWGFLAVVHGEKEISQIVQVQLDEVARYVNLNRDKIWRCLAILITPGCSLISMNLGALLRNIFPQPQSIPDPFR